MEPLCFFQTDVARVSQYGLRIEYDDRGIVAGLDQRVVSTKLSAPGIFSRSDPLYEWEHGAGVIQEFSKFDYDLPARPGPKLDSKILYSTVGK